MKKKQVEKEQNNEKQLPRQETTLGEDIFTTVIEDCSYHFGGHPCFYIYVRDGENQ